jgi:hypothetical protein
MTKDQFIQILFKWQQAHLSPNQKDYEKELLIRLTNEFDFYNDTQKKVLINFGLEATDTLDYTNKLLNYFNSKEKTIYVVTRCACEENYTPQAFKHFDEAYSCMKREFDKERDSFSSNIDTTTFSRTTAYIQYKDESYDKWEIFTMQVN